MKKTNNSFEQAKNHARSQIEWYFDEGYFPDIFPSIFRTLELGAYKEDFDWQTALKESIHDYEAFEALKRHCSFNIRNQIKLPRELEIWLANFLDEICIQPSRNVGAKKKPDAMKFYLGQLIIHLCRDYQLKPTRNPETKAKNCAVDAVLKAIEELPQSYDIRPRSYSGLVEAYYSAKKSNENVSK